MQKLFLISNNNIDKADQIVNNNNNNVKHDKEAGNDWFKKH